MKSREDYFSRLLLIICKDGAKVREQANAKAGCLPLSIRNKRNSRNTRPCWPVTAGRISDRNEWLPYVRIAVLNAIWH